MEEISLIPPRIGFVLHLIEPAAGTTPSVGAAPDRREAVVRDAETDSRTVEEIGGGALRIVWRGHPLCGAAFAATAELTPTPEGDGWSYSFRYEGNASGLAVEFIDFPVLTVPRTDATALFVPRHSGLLLRPRWRDLAPGAVVAEDHATGLHFLAALDGADVSWYLDQRGDARLRPCRALVGNGINRISQNPVDRVGTATLAFRYAPQIVAGNRVAGELPFDGTIRLFRGDWFAAAEIYRRWAWEQPWAKAAFARPRGRLRDIAIWFWNRGGAEEVAPPVERFAAQTGLPVALDWYWWHKIPYDAGYPHFWPPREGAEAFAATVRRLVAEGVFVQPYTNGISWDKFAPAWETEGSFDSVVETDGEKPGDRYNAFLPSCFGVMCGEAPHFHARMRDLARRLRGCGVSGLYLDQIGCCGYRICRNPDHAHAPGGGTAVVEGYRRMLRDIAADNPGLLLSTEEAPESYLDLVESFITLFHAEERMGLPPSPEAEAVPAFTAVYHGAITAYGSYAMIDGIPPWDEAWPDDESRWTEEKPWEALYPDQFAFEFARGVAMGLQPTVHQLRMRHFDDPRYAANLAFVVDTAAFYYENRDFLHDGTMCAPGVLDCARRPVDLFVRGIYTKPGEGRAVRRPAAPAVFHAVWRAPDGRLAATLCNWTREPQPFALRTPDLAVSGTLPARSWMKATP